MWWRRCRNGSAPEVWWHQVQEHAHVQQVQLVWGLMCITGAAFEQHGCEVGIDALVHKQ